MVLPFKDFVGNSKGEDFIWKKFKSILPEEYISFHNYYLGLKQPDIILLVPNRGILVIEIKGFFAKNILDVPDITSIRMKGELPIYSPLAQAVNYRNILINDYLLNNNIDSVYTIAAVCYPFISKNEYYDKELSKISNERLTITSEDIETFEIFKKKIDDIFDFAYDKINVPSLIKYGFDSALCDKVGNLISDNFKNINNNYNHENLLNTYNKKNREFYSRLICHNSNDILTENEINSIVESWISGTKIYFYSDDKDLVENIFNLIKDKVNILGLSNRAEFSGENIFLFNYGYTSNISRSFEILNGYNYEEYLNDFEILHNNSSFNKDQYIIEHAPLKDIIVKAGAGTGKTYSIVSRINFLIWKNNYNPEEFKQAIAMITFTNESADAMKEKLSQNFINYYLLTKDINYLHFIDNVENMNISTIHSMARNILKKYSSYIGLGKDFNIITGNFKRYKILDENLNEFIKNNKKIKLNNDLSIFQLSQRLVNFLEKLDNKNIDIVNEKDKLNFGSNNEFNALIDVIYNTQKDIDEYCKLNNSIALGDLIRKLKVLYKKLEADKIDINYKVDFLFVDEFQDTDDVQIELMSLFKKLFNFKFFVVGDIKQCIYRFRGAEVRAFDTLANSNPEPIMTISLNKNYRTDTILLNKLNEIFIKWNSNNDIDYENDDILNGTKEYCEKEEFYNITYNNADEFKNRFIRSLKKLKPMLPNEKAKIAILVRYNWQISEIRELCTSNGINIETEIGGELFKIDPTIDLFKLILALKYNTSPKHLYNLYTTSYICEEIQKVNIWNENKENIVEYFYNNIPNSIKNWNDYVSRLRSEPVLKVLRDIVDDVKPWKIFSKKVGATDEDIKRSESYYIRNLDQLFENLINASNTDYLTINKLSDYLEIMILTRREEEARESYDVEKSKSQIICTTIHKSKGLEFDIVILPYCNFDISCSRSKGDVDLIYSGNDIGYRIMGNDYKVLFENDLYKNFQKNEVIDRKHEETRILYVALTRAIRKIVYFSNENPNDKKYKYDWENLIKGV